MEIEKKIYEKMINEKLDFTQMSKLIEPETKPSALRYIISNFCKKNGLDMPKSKAGRKSRELNLKIMGE